MDLILIAPVLLSFFVVLLLVPFWIRKAKQIGLIWDDMNKLDSDKVAGSGGVIVLLGFVLGVLIFVAHSVFISKTEDFTITQIFATLVVITFLSGIGLVDDLLGWRQGGLSRRSRVILVLFATIPLMAINAGRSVISLPFIGLVDLGILYPLLIVPLGIATTSTTFNFLAGFNGLEAGQGIIVLSGLTLVSFATGHSWLGIVSLCMIASLIGFLFYNYFPAKVFPGDSLTYAVGGLIGIIPIVGNFEKIAVFFFIPYLIEIALKVRGGLVKHSFGKPNSRGHLELKYDKFYSLNHIAIWILNKSGIGATEKRAVYLIWIFQIIIILIGLIVFGQGLWAV